MGGTKNHKLRRAYAQTRHVSYTRRSSKYFDEFTRLKCAPSLLEEEIFPNAKEITESMTAFNAVRQTLAKVHPQKLAALGDPQIAMLDVGSGIHPRTAALFAHRTAWRCNAIDPLLRRDKELKHTRRVFLSKSKIEEFFLPSIDTAIVTCVHAHIALAAIAKNIQATNMILVAMPCCVDLSLDHPNFRLLDHYEDWACWSDKREVKVYTKGFENND